MCEGFFFDPFCVVERSKINLGSVGAGVPFSGEVFFFFWRSSCVGTVGYPALISFPKFRL